MNVVVGLALIVALVLWTYYWRRRIEVKKAAAVMFDELLDALEDGEA
jgi:predicted negative regulator of RcsB-dependent stress response